MPSPNDAWIEYASADLDAADRLLKSPHPNSWTFLLAAWHCHQAIEKMLKRIMVAREKEVIKTHDLVRLQELTGTPFSDVQITFIKKLDTFYIRPRYPDFMYPSFPQIDANAAQTFFDETKRFFLWLKTKA